MPKCGFCRTDRCVIGSVTITSKMPNNPLNYTSITCQTCLDQLMSKKDLYSWRVQATLDVGKITDG
jgi:hypothetical protein